MQEPHDFLELADRTLQETRHESPRLLPSSFDASDTSLQAIPVSREYAWSSLADTLKFNDTKIALVRLPLFWQVLPLVHHACIEAGCSLFVNEKENMPLGEAALRTGGANTVITDTQDSFEFSLFCAERKTVVFNWVIIHQPDTDWKSPIMIDDRARVVQEVHISPGIPLLTQCEILSAQRSPLFHTAPGIAIECEKETTYVTCTHPALVPFDRFALHRSLSPQGTCVCGQSLFTSNAQ